MTARQPTPPTNWRRASDLTMAEAARVLKCSKSHAYALAEAGGLPTHQDQLGRLRVKPADLEPLVATQQANDDAQADLFGGGA